MREIGRVTPKKIIKKIHLYLGLSAGLVIFIVALSGSVLVFEEDLKPVVYPKIYNLKIPENPTPLPIDTLVSVARKYVRNAESLLSVLTYYKATFPVLLTFGKSKHNAQVMALNPYTGAVLSVALHEEASFFLVVMQLHRFLCLGKVGKAITGVSCIIFIVMLCSGLVLWWPKKKHCAQRLKISLSSSKKKRTWVFHAIFGFYIFPVALLIALSGLVFSYKWASNAVYRIFDGNKHFEKQKKKSLHKPSEENLPKITDFPITSMVAQAKTIFPPTGNIRIAIPQKPEEPVIVVQYHYGDNVKRKRNILHFTPQGKLIKKDLFHTASTGEKIRRINFSLHTGLLAGRATQIIFLIVALVIASLPFSGFLMYYWRMRKKKKNIVS